MIPQQLSDTPPVEFRKQLHQLADWIADFREHMDKLRVAPNDKPGNIRAQLPRQAPDEGESFERILSDVDGIILPGMVHWSHPMFLGYFGWTSTAPGILGRNSQCAAECERDDVAYLSRCDRARNSCCRLAAAMGRFA